MAATYRFGIVGCGVIAPAHADAVLQVKNAELTAVCDIRADKADAFARRYQVERVYTDYRQLVADQQVDVVCVCTPSGSHGEVVIAAANSGKHIFCEKPIEITRAKLDAMIRIVAERKVKMGCVFQKRTSAVYKKVKEGIASGQFGSLLLADVYQKYYRSQPYYDSADWRGTWALDGGGALMNQAIHGIDLLLWLAGDVERVFARTAALARKIEVEDTAVALLQFKSGAFGVIEATTSVTPAQKLRMEIHGEKGTIVFDDRGISQWQVAGQEAEATPSVAGVIDQTSSDPAGLASSSHLALVEDLLEAIEQDRSPLIPPQEAARSVNLILAIYESARTGKDVCL